MDEGDLQNTLADQSYGEDADTGASWGYVSEGSKSSGATDGTMFSTLRYAVEGRDIAYRFGDLEPGRYSVHVGYADPWDQWDDRGARVSVNGTVVEEDHDYVAADETRSYGDITVGDAGEIELVLAPTRDADVQVSWIMVTLDEAVTPEAPEITISSDAVTMRRQHHGRGRRARAAWRMCRSRCTPTRSTWARWRLTRPERRR